VTTYQIVRGLEELVACGALVVLLVGREGALSVAVQAEQDLVR
jgi:hypothetical protein